MIYLIDEKIERQVKYGWAQERFLKYREVLTVVSDYTKLKEITSKVILSNADNVVLLHDSFFKNLDIAQKDVISFKNEIHTAKLYQVTFGGSFSSTSLQERELELQVSQFYRNLQIFLEKATDLRLLAFGEDFKKEEFFEIKNSVWNFLFKYDDLYILSENDKYKLREKVKFNEFVSDVLDKCNSVAEIKSNMNKWKI